MEVRARPPQRHRVDSTTHRLSDPAGSPDLGLGRGGPGQPRRRGPEQHAGHGCRSRQRGQWLEPVMVAASARQQVITTHLGPACVTAVRYDTASVGTLPPASHNHTPRARTCLAGWRARSYTRRRTWPSSPPAGLEHQTTRSKAVLRRTRDLVKIAVIQATANRRPRRAARAAGTMSENVKKHLGVTPQTPLLEGAVERTCSSGQRFRTRSCSDAGVMLCPALYRTQLA